MRSPAQVQPAMLGEGHICIYGILQISHTIPIISILGGCYYPLLPLAILPIITCYQVGNLQIPSSTKWIIIMFTIIILLLH